MRTREELKMTSNRDKHVIECWLLLYNRLIGTSYVVVDWPDKDSSRKNIDAMCRDNSGSALAVEHTLIQPFEGEKQDADRFMKTLASLQNHPDLLEPGIMVIASLRVGAISTGIDWKQIPNELLRQLRSALPDLAVGRPSIVTIKGTNWTVDVQIDKMRIGQNDPGKLLTMRVWPGDPGPELVINALKEKVPKLSAHANAKKMLLLEQDVSAGTTESQFEQLPDDPEIKGLLGLIDEVWSANTSVLESDGTIFTNQIWPTIRTNRCSLDLHTRRFWRGPC